MKTDDLNHPSAFFSEKSDVYHPSALFRKKDETSGCFLPKLESMTEFAGHDGNPRQFPEVSLLRRLTKEKFNNVLEILKTLAELFEKKVAR